MSITDSQVPERVVTEGTRTSSLCLLVQVVLTVAHVLSSTVGTLPELALCHLDLKPPEMSLNKPVFVF